MWSFDGASQLLFCDSSPWTFGDVIVIVDMKENIHDIWKVKSETNSTIITNNVIEVYGQIGMWHWWSNTKSLCALKDTVTIYSNSNFHKIQDIQPFWKVHLKNELILGQINFDTFGSECTNKLHKYMFLWMRGRHWAQLEASGST